MRSMPSIGLLRLGNCAMAFAGVMIGAMVELGIIGVLFTSFVSPPNLQPGLLQMIFPLVRFPTGVFVLLAAVAAFLVTGAGNALNDYYDRTIDIKAHPERPIPSGLVKPKDALNFAKGLFIAGIATSLFVNYICVIIALINTVLLIYYEKGLKAKGLKGNVTISYLTASIFLFGGASVSTLRFSLVLFLLAFLANIGREIAKDIMDMKADRGHRKTLPLTHGKPYAARTSATFVLLAVALSPLPALSTFVPDMIIINELFRNRFFSTIGYLPFVIVADVMFIYSCSLVFKSPSEAQSWMKSGMNVSLLAFIMGVVVNFIRLWGI